MSAHIEDTFLPSSNNRGQSIDETGKMMYDVQSIKLFDIGEVSNLLKVSRTTVYRLINSKQLLAKKLGSRTVLTADAIIDYINSLEDYEGGSNGF